MFYSKLYTLFRHKYLILVLLLWGCSSDPGDSPVVIEDDPDEVTITFSAGNASTLTRATTFTAGTPLKIYVYRHSGSTVDFSAAPYKVVEGETTSDVVDGLSAVKLTGGNITEDGRLTVRSNNTYDFIVVINASASVSSGTTPNLGTLSSGILTGFLHGSDILAGRKEKYIAADGSTANITFTGYGADAQGNLPHLCCAVVTEARATEDLISYLLKDGGGQFVYEVAGMDFKQCLPKSANLSFSGDPLALTVVGSGYNTSYSASILGEQKVVTNTSDVAVSRDCILLPYPLREGGDHNTMNIDFRLRVNGGEALFQATNIHVPEFEPGYRYRFIVEMDEPDDSGGDGVIKLLLSVESWSAVNWYSGMGEGETQVLMLLSLGSWSSVAWQSAMGGGDTGGMLLATVGGWNSITWGSQMGE
jgi:hypothetical protein